MHPVRKVWLRRHRAWLALCSTPVVLLVTMIVIESVAGIAGWGDDNGTGLADAAATAAFLAANLTPPGAAIVFGVRDWRASGRRAPVLAAIAAVALIALSIWGVVTDPARGVV
jgi:hypothetical protein